MKKHTGWSIIFTFLLVVACQQNKPVVEDGPALQAVYKNVFMVGTALSANQSDGNDEKSLALALKHFNSITPENILKWEKVHPELNTYNFKPVDLFVELGQKNKMFMVGHTLVWHEQTPDWVFEDELGKALDREVLLKRMKEHIFAVVGRYKGKINGWDVVNEAIEDQGTWRKTKWYEIIGEDFLEKAFQFAHEADLDAELYYNDFNMWKKGKVKAVVKMVKNLQSKGIPIHGIGLQGHWGLDYPPMDQLEKSLKAYAETGLKIMITEMDIRVLPNPGSDTGADITKNYELQAKLNPYPDKLPDSMQVKLADRYAEFFKLLIKYKDNISRVTLWGVHDGVSWCNNWPVRGRTDYPLLFDRELKPKAAFHKLTSLVE